ncbi:MAG: DUF1707 domain-containing protein [Actinomycetota bacterium]|nr:DUF1707 domain-containing protein [Actinomycetota bacterium]
MPPQNHLGEVSSADRETGLRVSDRERARVVDLLSEHAAEGRLSLEELDARTDGALAARTRGELAVLTRDLPGSGGGDDPAAPPTRLARRPLTEPSRQLTAFVAVNLVLVAVWALSGGGYFWPAWPILGWGLGLAKGGPCGRPRLTARTAHRSAREAAP